jgi:hypothetical protein
MRRYCRERQDGRPVECASAFKQCLLKEASAPDAGPGPRQIPVIRHAPAVSAAVRYHSRGVGRPVRTLKQAIACLLFCALPLRFLPAVAGSA